MHSSGRPGLGYRVSVSVIVRVRNQEARLSEIFSRIACSLPLLGRTQSISKHNFTTLRLALTNSGD